MICTTAAVAVLAEVVVVVLAVIVILVGAAANVWRKKTEGGDAEGWKGGSSTPGREREMRFATLTIVLEAYSISESVVTVRTVSRGPRHRRRTSRETSGLPSGLHGGDVDGCPPSPEGRGWQTIETTVHAQERQRRRSGIGVPS